MLTVPTPKIPMSPSELPQQRLVEVVELPARPNPFRFQVGYGGFPAEVLPKQGVPRSPRYLFQCEWAEGPGNGSVDAFYLHARKKHWLLWLRYLDENADPWRCDGSSLGTASATAFPKRRLRHISCSNIGQRQPATAAPSRRRSNG